MLTRITSTNIWLLFSIVVLACHPSFGTDAKTPRDPAIPQHPDFAHSYTSCFVRIYNQNELLPFSKRSHCSLESICDRALDRFQMDASLQLCHKQTIIYAVNTSGLLYFALKNDSEVHHDHLVEQKDVWAAGEMILEPSSVKMINNLSGHYRPPKETLPFVLRILASQGLDISKTKIIEAGDIKITNEAKGQVIEYKTNESSYVGLEYVLAHTDDRLSDLINSIQQGQLLEGLPDDPRDIRLPFLLSSNHSCVKENEAALSLIPKELGFITVSLLDLVTIFSPDDCLQRDIQFLQAFSVNGVDRFFETQRNSLGFTYIGNLIYLGKLLSCY